MPGSGSCPTILLPNTTSAADFGLWAKAGAATNVAKATIVARVLMSHLRVAEGYRWDRVYTARDKPAVNCVTSVRIFWTTSAVRLSPAGTSWRFHLDGTGRRGGSLKLIGRWWLDGAPAGSRGMQSDREARSCGSWRRARCLRSSTTRR